jgi:MFS family permease
VPGWCLVVTCTLFLASYLWLPAWAAYPLQLVGFFTATLAIPALRAGFTDAVPAQLRGAGFGAFALASVLFGSGLAPVATSFIATRLGDDFRNAFLVLTPVAYVGAALLLMARDHLERDTQALFAAVARAIAEQSGASAPRPRPEG